MALPFALRTAALYALLTTSIATCGAAQVNATYARSPQHGMLASTPTPGQLATLVFPGWSDTHTGRLQTVALPAGGSGYTNWGSGTARVIVDPNLVLRADPDHLTLIASMVPAAQDGRPSVNHMTPMGLAAYQFVHGSAGWKLAARQGLFAWRGFFGEATLRPLTLTTRRQGVMVEYGSCWEGYCGTWLAIYELDKNMVRHEPAVELALSGNNVDGATDCARRLQPLVKNRTQDGSAHDDGTPPGAHDCYIIESSWNIEPGREQPGDLAVRYQGAISRADSYAGPPVPVDQRQVLHYSNGKYRAVSGFNPVPPI